MATDKKPEAPDPLDYTSPLKKIKVYGRVAEIVDNLKLTLDSLNTPLALIAENMVASKLDLQKEFNDRGNVYDIVPAFQSTKMYVRFSENYQALKQKELEALINSVVKLAEAITKEQEKYKGMVELEEKKKREEAARQEYAKSEKQKEDSKEEIRFPTVFIKKEAQEEQQAEEYKEATP